jgi:hypothetical protein
VNALPSTHRTARPAFAALLLSLVLGTSLAQAAPADGVAAGKANAVVATPPAAPASAHISPHARAARERAAAAQAEAAASGIRVSAFTARRKPHKLAGGR